MTDTWEGLAEVATKLGVSMRDFVESYARVYGVDWGNEPKLPDSYYETALSKREQDTLLEVNSSTNLICDRYACQMLINYGLIRKVISTKRLVVDEPTMSKEKYELTPLGITLMENYKTYGKFIFFLAEG